MTSKWTKKNIFIEFVLATLFAFSLALFFIFSNSNGKNKTLNLDQQAKVAQIKMQIDDKQHQLNQEAYQKALDDPSQVVKMNVRQIQASQLAKTQANKLFPILLNFSTSKEYNSRADKSQNLVTENVLRNKNLYGDDYSDSSHYVDASGYHSKFDSVEISDGLLKGNELPVIMHVNSINWFSGQHKGQTGDIYVGTFDYQSHKFSQLQILNNLYRGNLTVNQGQ